MGSINRKFKRECIVLLLVLSVILLSVPAHAAEVEEEVLEELKENGEVSVIVILKDEPVKEKEMRDEKKGMRDRKGMKVLTENQPRKEMIKKVQENVLNTLEVEEINDGEKAENLNLFNEENDNEENEKPDLKLVRQFSNLNGFSGELTEEGMEKLKNNPSVERIVANRILQTTLASSVPQIEGSDAWNLSVGGYNITGELETVCFIDSGIQTNHSAFTNKIRAQHCFCSLTNSDDGLSCCPGNTAEELSAEDDYGHGTHVAGIAAGNLSAYQGVAKGAGIVAIKTCNAAGSCNTADVISAIEWCTNNATTYNISVISLSLGDSTQNNVYCNSDAIASSINSAVGQNISVVIATGNNGYTSGISAPACVENATPVGAVNDNDDDILYNRGSILNLVAPGSTITAPYTGADGITTTSLSGTSMSAPHVSGAVALLRQYWRLAYGRTPTPSEIEWKLMVTGKEITESGNSYRRIDVMAAIRPFINFTSSNPANNTRINANNTFINATSDVNLTNAFLEWHYPNSSIINYTMNKIDSTNGTSFYFNVTHLSERGGFYYVYGNDTAGTLGVSSARNLTVDTTLPAVIISTPANGSNFSRGTQSFNATIGETAINSVMFSFDNATGNGFNVTPTNVSGNWNTNLDLLRLAEGLNTMTVLANDTAGNANNTQFVEFTIDRTPPAVTISTPLNERNYTIASGNQTFNITISDATLSVETVRLSFDNASGIGFNVTAAIISGAANSGVWSASYNVSNLEQGTHTVTILANDTISNLNNTQTLTFNLNSPYPVVTLNRPAAQTNTSNTSITFNCSVTDDLGVLNLTLYGNWTGSWQANETASVNGTSNESAFSKTLSDGVYAWNCLAYDASGYLNFSSANYTLTVDTLRPGITSVSSGTPTATGTTITWTTNERANSSVHYGTSESLGSTRTSLSLATSHSRSLSSLTASTLYYYNVTSCDPSGNCNTTGTRNFTTAAASSSDSGSSSGSSSSSGGGSSSSTDSDDSEDSDSSDEDEEAEDTEEVTTQADEEEGGSTTTEEVAAEEVPLTVLAHSQPASLTEGEESIIPVEGGGIAVSKIKIKSKASKETVFEFNTFTEKPEAVSELGGEEAGSLGVYQYFEIMVNLTEDEIKKAYLTFKVPKSWLTEKNFTQESVSLYTFEDGEWVELPTKLVREGSEEGETSGEGREELLYEARLEHFSYFAITAAAEGEMSFVGLAFGAVGKIAGGMNKKVVFLLGLLALIVIMGIFYFRMRERF